MFLWALSLCKLHWTAVRRHGSVSYQGRYKKSCRSNEVISALRPTCFLVNKSSSTLLSTYLLFVVSGAAESIFSHTDKVPWSVFQASRLGRAI
jgi:hypothetical protein